MRIKTIILVLVLSSFSFSMLAQEAEDLIAQGDEIYAQMKDMASAEEALAKYREALPKAENKYHVYWRIARILYYIGDHTESKKEKKKIFSQGIYYGKKAVELEPEKPDGHYWLGVNYGLYGETRGVLKSLFLVDDIKEAMNKVIELDRSYEDGGPDRVLGRVYFKLPGLAGGSKEKSLQHLLKSKQFGPQDALTRVYLADTYLELDEVEKAREELEYVLNKEPDPRWISGRGDLKEMAEEMLQRKGFRKK
ncbi:MAG: TRAP transporter TatT component family protein [Candidatus Aminicenantes bacterium]